MLVSRNFLVNKIILLIIASFVLTAVWFLDVQDWDTFMLTAHSPEVLRKIVCLLLTLCAALCAGQTIRGTVRNGTEGKPQSGDPVLLMMGANEIGRAVTDEKGDFRIDPQLPSGTSADTLRVSVSHDGVSYQQPVRLGVSANVNVYDAAARVEGLSEDLGIFQFETRAADSVTVTELHALHNDSWPPRTRVGPQNFELRLPHGAHNLFVTIMEPDGHGASLTYPGTSNQSAPYRLGVPLEPGVTKYVLTYALPYAGELPFRRSAQYSAKKTIIVLPQSMHFAAPSSLHFQPVPDTTGAQVREIDSLANHAVLAFQISGTGVLAQAFRLIGAPQEPAQPEKVETSPSSTPQASAASSQPDQKPQEPGTHSEPHSDPHSETTSQSLRNWAVFVLVLLMLGTLVAWKYVRAKSHHRSA